MTGSHPDDHSGPFPPKTPGDSDGDPRRSGEPLRPYAQFTRAGAVLAGLLVFALVFAAILSTYSLLPVVSSRNAVADVVRIPSRTSTREIAQLLEDAGIVRSAKGFVIASRLLGNDGHLQAGDYELSPGMNLLAVLNRLERGEVATVRVTIPEGFNMRQIAATLAQRGLVDEERFLAVASRGRALVSSFVPFDIPVESLEGYLYPDTYLFPRSIDEEGIVQRMVARFVQEAYPLIAAGLAQEGPPSRQPTPRSLGLTVHEVTTLASIVEKEAMVDEERARIASVFLNRLAIGQPLQADPTVQYVMPNPRARLFHRDLAIDSPYNTYRYRGLPPGPIASPGKASLQAVLHPEDTPYLYFVARGDGTHVFSRTFAEHIEARRRVRR